jgi:hypothetical protein
LMTRVMTNSRQFRDLSIHLLYRYKAQVCHDLLGLGG